MSNFVYSGNSDRVVEVVATDPTESNTPTSGTWSVELKNNSSSSTTVNGWIPRNSIGTDSQPITYAGGNTQSTVGIPGTATHAITVGSFMHRWRWYGSDDSEHRLPTSENRSGNISLFSSEGPRRDGTQEAYKPEIAAPGQNMISSLSQDASSPSALTISGGMHVIKKGTSMSAPVVAGSISLFLQEDPSLTPTQIKDLITQTADSDGFTGTTPNTEWGYGRFDALEAMTQLVNSSGSATYSIFSDDFHPNSSYEGVFKVGSDGDDAHAIRFTPSVDGRLSGAYFHLYYPSANNLTDSLTVELRTDNGGVPGPQIGSAVKISPSRLRTGTWNYQSLLGTDTQLNAGQDYYLVYYPSKPDDALYLMGESYDASGNSLYLSSGTWQEDGTYDLLVRPVVSSLSGVTALPVELVAFGAEVSGQSATLNWQTASETNNARFEVQQLQQEGGWKTVGQVEGAGTTTEAQRYSYEAAGLSYGTHRFRLRQVDLDGSAHTSKEIKAVVKPTESLSVQAYPNPISTTATVKVATGQPQDVSVEIYDLLGRQVAQLHEGTVSPKRPETLTLESSSLSSGTYFLRARGESATTTKRISIVR